MGINDRTDSLPGRRRADQPHDAINNGTGSLSGIPFAVRPRWLRAGPPKRQASPDNAGMGSCKKGHLSGTIGIPYFQMSSLHPQKNEHRNAVPVFHFLAVLSKRDYPGKTGIHAGKTPAPIGCLGRKGSWRSGHRMDSPTSRRPLSRRLPLSPFTYYAIPYSP